MPGEGKTRLSGTCIDIDFYNAEQRDDCDGLSEKMKWSPNYDLDLERAKVTDTELSVPPKLLISPTWNTD